MKDFEFYSPKTVAEAAGLLRKLGTAARVIAGGTELVNQIRKGTARPDYLIDLKRIPGLDNIELSGGGLRLGALARIRDTERSVVVRNDYAAIREAARVLGSPQVRSKATIAGNICRASPSADMVPPLIALAATVNITGPSSERSLPVEELFLGPARTVLTADEIVIEVLVPPPARHSACVYLKLSPRHAMDLAVVGVAAMLACDSAGRKCSTVRIALGAVGPTPMRARKAEEVLEGGKLDEASIVEAARQASRECSPISDVRASESYRRQMVEVMVRRALTSARNQIQDDRR